MTTSKATPPQAHDRPPLEGLATPRDVEPVYPRWAWQLGGLSQVVNSEAEALALGDGWSWAADPPPPVVTALEPSSAALGAPSFTLHVRGTDFIEGAVIVFAGHDEPTTWVSPTELTTGVDMGVWTGPDPAVPVLVRRVDGTLSNTLTFAFTAAAAAASRARGAAPRPDES